LVPRSSPISAPRTGMSAAASVNGRTGIRVFNHGFSQMAKPIKNGARVRRAPFCNDSLVALTGVRLLGGNPIDIRTGNADIGELAIGEVGKLPLHGFVPLPSLIEAGDRGKHRFARPFPGGLSGHPGISAYI